MKLTDRLRNFVFDHCRLLIFGISTPKLLHVVEQESSLEANMLRVVCCLLMGLPGLVWAIPSVEWERHFNAQPEDNVMVLPDAGCVEMTTTGQGYWRISRRDSSDLMVWDHLTSLATTEVPHLEFSHPDQSVYITNYPVLNGILYVEKRGLDGTLQYTREIVLGTVFNDPVSFTVFFQAELSDGGFVLWGHNQIARFTQYGDPVWASSIFSLPFTYGNQAVVATNTDDIILYHTDSAPLLSTTSNAQSPDGVISHAKFSGASGQLLYSHTFPSSSAGYRTYYQTNAILPTTEDGDLIVFYQKRREPEEFGSVPEGAGTSSNIEFHAMVVNTSGTIEEDVDLESYLGVTQEVTQLSHTIIGRWCSDSRETLCWAEGWTSHIIRGTANYSVPGAFSAWGSSFYFLQIETTDDFVTSPGGYVQKASYVVRRWDNDNTPGWKKIIVPATTESVFGCVPGEYPAHDRAVRFYATGTGFVVGNKYSRYRLGNEGAIAGHTQDRNYIVDETNMVSIKKFSTFSGSFWLHYRVGNDSYQSVQMTSGTGNSFLYSLPADFCAGDSIGYYVEARDGQGETVELLGSPSEPFVLRPKWKLRRNGTAFDPMTHGWSFRNRQSDIWPDSWDAELHELDERCDCDSNSNLCYPNWELFRETFGSVQTEYIELPSQTVHRRPYAENIWKGTKKCWPGSCGGFTRSSLLFFNEDLSIAESLGLPYANVYAVSNADASARFLINKLQAAHLSREWASYASAASVFTANRTLDSIKTMIQGNNPVGRALVFDTKEYRHAVVPFEIADEGDSLWYVTCYDPNGADVHFRFDQRANGGAGSWVSMDYEGTYKNECFLEPAPLTFLGPLTIYESPSRTLCADTSVSLIVAANSFEFTGDLCAFGENFMESGLYFRFGLEFVNPVFPLTGVDVLPAAFDAPSDAYTVDFLPEYLEDGTTVATASALMNTSCAMYRVQRNSMTTPAPSFDEFMIDTDSQKVGVRSVDLAGQTSVIEIVRVGGNQEIAVSAEDILFSSVYDEVNLRLTDTTAIVSFLSNTVDLRLKITDVTNGVGARFESNEFSPPGPGATNLIVPAGWSAANDTLVAWYDLDLDGTPDSAIFLENQFVVHCDSLAPALPPDSLTVFLLDSNQLVLRWSPVTLDTDSLPIIVDHYSVHGSSSLEFSDTLYWAETNNTMVTDTQSVQAQNAMFFRVSASRCP